MRRRVTRYAELTSLLDVLFILLFAALIQAGGAVRAAEPTREAPSEPSPPEPAPPESHAELKQRAVDELTQSIHRRGAVYARVSRTGELTAIEQEQGGSIHRLDVATPLVEQVQDRDIGVVYLGKRTRDLRLCTRMRVTLGMPDLSDRLVVFVLDAPMEELSFALGRGPAHRPTTLLRRRARPCYYRRAGGGVSVSQTRSKRRKGPVIAGGRSGVVRTAIWLVRARLARGAATAMAMAMAMRSSRQNRTRRSSQPSPDARYASTRQACLWPECQALWRPPSARARSWARQTCSLRGTPSTAPSRPWRLRSRTPVCVCIPPSEHRPIRSSLAGNCCRTNGFVVVRAEYFQRLLRGLIAGPRQFVRKVDQQGPRRYPSNDADRPNQPNQ